MQDTLEAAKHEATLKIKLPGKRFFIKLFMFHSLNPHICLWAFWPVFVKRDRMQYYQVDCWMVLIEEQRVLLSHSCVWTLSEKCWYEEKRGKMKNSKHWYCPFTPYTAILMVFMYSFRFEIFATISISFKLKDVWMLGDKLDFVHLAISTKIMKMNYGCHFETCINSVHL